MLQISRGAPMFISVPLLIIKISQILLKLPLKKAGGRRQEAEGQIVFYRIKPSINYDFVTAMKTPQSPYE
jgi:hypothetical protein